MFYSYSVELHKIELVDKKKAAVGTDVFLNVLHLS